MCCGAEEKSSKKRAVSSSRPGRDERSGEGSGGQLRRDADDDLCCGWRPRALRGPRTDRGARHSPVTSVWMEMSESRSKVRTASFTACMKAGGEGEVRRGIHFSFCYCMYGSFSWCFSPTRGSGSFTHFCEC